MLIDDGVDNSVDRVEDDLIPALYVFPTLLDIVQLLLVDLLTLRFVSMDSLSCDGLSVQDLEVLLASH